MPHIELPEGLPGIASAFAFRPETAKPLRELAEILPRGPGSLSSAEREMIATFVSTRNDCYFCQTSHRAAAAHHTGGSYEPVDAVRFDYPSAPVSAKLKTLLAIAGKVQQVGKNVTAEDIQHARPGRLDRSRNPRRSADRGRLLHVQPLCGWFGHLYSHGQSRVVLYDQMGACTAYDGYTKAAGNVRPHDVSSGNGETDE